MIGQSLLTGLVTGLLAGLGAGLVAGLGAGLACDCSAGCAGWAAHAAAVTMPAVSTSVASERVRIVGAVFMGVTPAKVDLECEADEVSVDSWGVRIAEVLGGG